VNTNSSGTGCALAVVLGLVVSVAAFALVGVYRG